MTLDFMHFTVNNKMTLQHVLRHCFWQKALHASYHRLIFPLFKPTVHVHTQRWAEMFSLPLSAVCLCRMVNFLSLPCTITCLFIKHIGWVTSPDMLESWELGLWPRTPSYKMFPLFFFLWYWGLNSGPTP
jgi:hypothetical protein